MIDAPVSGSGSLRPLFTSEFVEPGTPVSVILAATKPWKQTAALAATVDGEPITVEVHRLRLTPPGRAQRWTTNPGSWSLEPVPESGVVEGESLVATTEPLPDGAAALTLDGSMITLRERPARGWPERGSASAHAAPAPEWLGATMDDPFRAWRADLAAALAESRPPARVRGDLGPLADQTTDRWRASLARVAEVDQALGARLAVNIARVVALPDGRGAPAWSEDFVRLNRLLAALDDPAATPAEVRAAAETWLVDEPAAVAWVIDDGGVDRPALFGVANLRPEPTTASVEAGGRVELVPIEALSVQTLALAMPIGAPTQRVAALVGPARFDLEVVTEPIPCAPPGVRMGPFQPEWTMPEWLGEAPASIDPRWATAALLQPAASGGSEGGWDLFLDCRASGVGEDRVRLIVGDPSEPGGELMVSREGEIVGSGSCRGAKGTVLEEPDRWTAVLRLPAGALAGTVVTLGLERIDARGARSHWPRRAAPWQEAMSAAAIDLSAWGGAATREAP